MTFDKMVSLELSKIGYKLSYKVYPKPILELFDKKVGKKPIVTLLNTRTHQTFKCIKVPSLIRVFYASRYLNSANFQAPPKSQKVCTHSLKGGKNNKLYNPSFKKSLVAPQTD